MSLTTRHRAIPLLLAAAVTLTLSATLPGQGLSSAVAATAQPAVVQAGLDYATKTFGDPWDYNNVSDLILDTGPAWGLTQPSWSLGQVTFTTHAGYVSPLWGGYGTEVPVEREGTRSGNALVANTYTRMHLRIFVSVYTGGALNWYTCGALNPACNGSMNFVLKAGWNDIDLPIVRTSSTGKAWTGSMVGVRLALGAPVGSAIVHLDSLRLYRPSSAAAIGWSAPGNSPAALWWTDSAGSITPVVGLHAGPVANAPTSPNSSKRVNANVAGYAPGTFFWSVAGGVKTLVGSTAPAPMPVIDSPSAAGCGDYATRYLGHPWTFTSTSSLAARANIGALSFAGGVLSATNVAPKRNDPSISLPIAPGGINGRMYHRLTIVESYDGAFNLANRPGGGTMARVLWQSPGRALLAQTAPLVTFTGKRSITVDMAMPASQLTDPSGPPSQRYPFASASPVTRLRYDPNEDPGARRWHVYSVQLAADCQAGRSFPITWHDPRFVPGSTVQLYARAAAGHLYPLGSAVEHSGLNSFAVSMLSLPRGTYAAVIFVTNPANVVTSAVSTGPLLKI
jgi:hypothetical protein